MAGRRSSKSKSYASDGFSKGFFTPLIISNNLLAVALVSSKVPFGA